MNLNACVLLLFLSTQLLMSAHVTPQRTPAIGQRSQVFLPLVINNPFNLYGYVQDAGKPVPDQLIKLYEANLAGPPRPQGQTLSDSTGKYRFTGLESPMMDIPREGLFVAYYDPSAPPDRLVSWSSPLRPPATMVYQYPTANLTAPTLLQPQAGATIDFPVTFRWAPRPSELHDQYVLEIRGDYDREFYNVTNPFTVTFDQICNTEFEECRTFWQQDHAFVWWLELRNPSGDAATQTTGTFTITAPLGP
jgi:hypothetical protein